MTFSPPITAPTLTHDSMPSLWRRLTRGRSIVHSTPRWDEFAGAGWVERIMSEDAKDRFHAKQGRTIARWTLTHGERSLTVYLKRHYVLPRSFGAVLFPRRAWSPGLEEYEHLNWARDNAIPVPETPAVGEFLGPWGNLQSFLAVEELTGMLALHEAIPLSQSRLNSTDFSLWKRGLIVELARLARELHRRRAFHQDLYLCHFYIAESNTERIPEEWRGSVVMIDFHRLTIRRFLTRGMQIKDLAQLLYSSLDVSGINDRDRLRFWNDYLRGDWSGSSSPPSWVGRAARMKSRVYARHNAKSRLGVGEPKP